MAIRRDPIEFGELLLLERLGGGTQGDVWLARRRDGPAEPLVVKRIPFGRAGDTKLERRLRQEFEVAASIRHPNVVEVLFHGELDGRLYLAMRYVAGQALSAVMRTLVKKRQDATLEAVVDVVCDTLAGLGALHAARAPSGASREIVHRDIAPKNLMLDRHGRTIVIDLGLSKSAGRDWKTATGMIMGTPGYMAPEQAEARPADARTDLFAVGIVLFELLTLEPYTPGNTVVDIVAASTFDHFRPPSGIRRDLPKSIDDIVRRAVALKPEDRFQSAAEFATALRAIVPVSGRGSMTLVEDLVWSEVDDEVTRVTELVGGVAPTVGTDEIADTVASVAPTLPPTRPRIPPVTVAAGAVVVASGLALYFATRDGRIDQPPPPGPALVVPTKKPPTPMIEARPQTPTEPPKETPPPAPPPKAPPARRTAVKRAVRRAPPTEKKTPSPPPAEKSAFKTDPLIKRARAMLAKAATDDHRREAEKILILLNRLRLAEQQGRSIDLSTATKRLEALEPVL